MQEDVTESPKTAVVFDLDGTLLNYDEPGGYREIVENNLLKSASIGKILQDELDKEDGRQSNSETILSQAKQKIISTFWSAFDDIREEEGSPNRDRSVIEFCQRLEREGLLSERRFGSFEGDNPFGRAPRDVDDIPEPVLHEYSSDISPKIDRMTDEERRKWWEKAQQAHSRWYLAREVRQAFELGEEASMTLYPGAKEAVEAARKHGPLILWTEGDLEVQWDKIHDSELFPEEQGTLRPRYTVEEWVRNGYKQQWRKRDIPDKSFHKVSRDKKVDLETMLRELAAEGYSRIIIADDKVGNLVEVASAAERVGLADRVQSYWIQQGRHGTELPSGLTLEEASQRFHPVRNIKEFAETLEALP